MYCKYCKSKIPSSSQYCNECGKKLITTDNNEPSTGDNIPAVRFTGLFSIIPLTFRNSRKGEIFLIDDIGKEISLDKLWNKYIPFVENERWVNLDIKLLDYDKDRDNNFIKKIFNIIEKNKEFYRENEDEEEEYDNNNDQKILEVVEEGTLIIKPYGFINIITGNTGIIGYRPSIYGYNIYSEPMSLGERLEDFINRKVILSLKMEAERNRMMECDECGYKNEENSKYCSNCGNKLIIPVPTQTSKTELEPNRDFLDQNYKKIFNICFYSVIGCVASIIWVSLFIYSNWAGFIGTILDIFLNIWIWIFLIFIFIFRKNHKAWSLIVSIIFGFITIIAAVLSFLSPQWHQALKIFDTFRI